MLIATLFKLRKKGPRQGNALSAWIGEASEKDWPTRPSDRQPQEAWKKTPIGHKSCCRGSPCPCTLGTARVPASQEAVPPSRSTLTGAEMTQAKNVLHLCAQGRFSRVRLCSPIDCGLPGFSVRERASPGKNTGAYRPILVVIPFWSTIFPAALATNPPEYLVLPEPLRPRQLHHLHTWPSQGQTKPSRAASGANPSGQPTSRGGNKTTIETQGQCG